MRVLSSRTSLLRRGLPVWKGQAVPTSGWRFKHHGRVDRVLNYDDFDLSFDPSGSDVLVRPLASPVTRNDIAAVQGSWAVDTPTFPAVAGNECVAEVIEVGANASTKAKKGDRVIPLSPSHGTWATRAVFPGADIAVVPKSLPLEYASILAVAPLAAYNLLSNANLQRGDWIIQNGANGAVGSCVIGLAKELGLNTINVVRQRAGADDTVERLIAMGGNLVVTDDYLRRRAFQNLLSTKKGLIRPKLALNCVGGRGASELARNLAPGSIFRTYGGASRRAVDLPVSALVHNAITADGYLHPAWMAHTLETQPEGLQDLLGLVTKAIQDRKLTVFMQRFTGEQLPEAIAHTLTPGAGRRAILRFDGSPSSWGKLPAAEHSDIALDAIADVVEELRPRAFSADRPAFQKEFHSPQSIQH